MILHSFVYMLHTIISTYAHFPVSTMLALHLIKSYTIIKIHVRAPFRLIRQADPYFRLKTVNTQFLSPLAKPPYGFLKDEQAKIIAHLIPLFYDQIPKLDQNFQ